MSEDDVIAYEKRMKGTGSVRTHKLDGERVPTEGQDSKYGSETTVTKEGVFRSKKEANRWDELKLLEKARKIRNLKRQVRFVLAPAVVLYGRQIPALRYYADSTYEEAPAWNLVVEDVKGFHNPTYRIKRHLMATVHGIVIREV